MRGLAAYVMRGRTQALWVAVLSAGTPLLSWISAAVIALVTLRRGVGEGVSILIWAVLPAAAVLYWGEPGPLGMILGTTAIAATLRMTVSWQASLITSVLVGVIIGGLMYTAGSSYLQLIEQEVFGPLVSALEQQMQESGEQVEFIPPGPLQIAGILGFMNALVCTVCLILARWWQSVLYNPGGFGEEFRALRLTPQVTSVLLVTAVILAALGQEFRSWALIVALPLTFAGIALVHYMVARRGRGVQVLVFFYLFWLMFDFAKLVVAALAAADSFMDLRSRGRSEDNTDSE